MLKRLSTAILLLALLSTAGAVTVRITLSENFDGTFDTEFPSGDKDPGGSACTTLTCDDLGDAVGDSAEVSSSSFSLVCTGGTDDEGNICRAYDTFSSGDIQVVATIPATWTGATEPFTGFGIGIRDASGYAAQLWRPSSNAGFVFKTDVGGAGEAVQQYSEAVALPYSVGLYYDLSATDICAAASADGSTWVNVGACVDKTLTFDAEAYIFGTSHNTASTIIATLTNVAIDQTITIVGDDPDPPGPRQVKASLNFDSGQLQENGTNPDGVLMKTLPEPQTNTAACPGAATFGAGLVTECVVDNGGAGPASELEARVVTTDTVPANGNGGGSEVVLPRNGTHYLRTSIDFDKDYSRFGGNSNINKPRMTMTQEASYRTTFDTEGYTGMSVYLPANFEHETGKKGEQGKNNVLNMSNEQAFFAIQYFVPTGGTTANWYVLTHDSDSEMDIGTGNRSWTSLGSVVPDLGVWTDFVVRWRWNPFESGQGYTCPVNPVGDLAITGAVNEDFECDVGILQIWKSVGAADGNGDRVMELVYSELNEGTGLVPDADPNLIAHSIRQYKHAWHTQPTVVDGPIWHGYDEIHWGEVIRDNTTFQDVHATQKACATIASESGDCP